VVTAPVGWVARAFAGPSAATDPAAKVARFFSDPVGATHIGTAYLAVAPTENDATVLRAALAPEGEEPEAWWASVSVSELRRTIRKAAHADFAAGTVVDLEGWQLAPTEARLAALFTLSQ
jgi:hypothetical protein